MGYHLWFVGFLFSFSLLALPVFMWLNKDSGKRFIGSLARLAARRGILFVFVIPPVLFMAAQRGSFDEHGWSGFIYNLLFFISGYILVADERFAQAIRRDWLLHLIPGIVCTLFFFSSAAGVPVTDWMDSPGTLAFYISWAVFVINGWCWTMFMIYIGMRYLDRTNKWLQYGRETSYPFFILHQPVIIFIAFYAVQWQIALLVKLLVVVVGSFLITLGVIELLIRPFKPIRVLLGMKPPKKKRTETPAPRQ